MFSLTKQERLVLIFLTAALLVGAAVRIGGGRKVPPAPKPVELAWDLATPKPPARDLTAGAGTAAGAKVDVNHAGTAELCRIPGVGDELARRIVTYRATHPPFANADGLARVPGIGPTTARKIEPYITYGAAGK